MSFTRSFLSLIKTFGKVSRNKKLIAIIMYFHYLHFLLGTYVTFCEHFLLKTRNKHYELVIHIHQLIQVNQFENYLVDVYVPQPACSKLHQNLNCPFKEDFGGPFKENLIHIRKVK